MTLDILSIFAAIALHELAHVVAAVVLGVKVKRFGLCWRGVYIVREAGTDWQNLLISLTGPLSNFVASYVSLAVVHRGAIFCAMNLVIGSINLLPLPHSDGMRAYKLVKGIMSRARLNDLRSHKANNSASRSDDGRDTPLR
jgi:stage IV sporulation protein FB